MPKAIIYYIIIFFTGGCHQKTNSKWQVMMPEDDRITNAQKIDLIERQSTNLSPTSLAAIAKLYSSLEAWPKAIAAINDAIVQDPMNSSYHNMKARYAYRLGQKSVAYREALTAYQLGSRSLQQSLELAKMAAALSEFNIVGNIIDSLVLIYPDDIDIIYVAARKYDNEGNPLQARKNYHKVFKNRPGDQENILHFTRFLIAQNDLQSAKHVITHDSLSLLNRQLILLLADIHLGLEEYDSAALAYQSALVNGRDSTTYNSTIRAFKLAENLDSVISVAEAAVSTFPANKYYLHTAAKGLDQRYRYDESLVYYLTLYEMDTLDTLVAQEMAYVQRKIAYLQRRKEEQKKLADSLNKVLPVLTF